MSQQEVNISLELSALEEKKHALEKVYKIARAVEHLRHGLEAIVLLGKPTATISKQAVHVYESLSDKIKILPTLKIQQTLLRLDTIITKNLNTVLQAADPESTANVPEDQSPAAIPQRNIDTLIDSYRKNAQTAVALRVVMRERGVPTKPITWPVSDDLLAQRLNNIRAKERNYRKKIDTEIVKLEIDADQIIHNNSLPQAARDAAAHMRLMLHKDLEHIRAGKDIADLPFFVEVVVVEEKKDQPRMNIQPKSHFSAMPAAPSPGRRDKNILVKLWLWATTPLNVKWKDIDKL